MISKQYLSRDTLYCLTANLPAHIVSSKTSFRKRTYIIIINGSRIIINSDLILKLNHNLRKLLSYCNKLRYPQRVHSIFLSTTTTAPKNKIYKQDYLQYSCSKHSLWESSVRLYQNHCLSERCCTTTPSFSTLVCVLTN